ncbi:MAG: SAVED domain-containing protein, partial [Candidatus Methanoplasma sp.]|nr:SAVED domain-containing protein [Candidatus Methanoplasma sp.]
MNLSIETEYREIFEREIKTPCQNLIMIYSSKQDTHKFQPLSHHCANCATRCDDDCYQRLGALMRKNLVFYAYGEEEVVSNVKNGLFENFEKAIDYAYKNRLPKRSPPQDGLPGEVLLDLIVQILEPDAYKLAVRTLLRQDDNNEIKGYDLTYFTFANDQTTLWLGQAK